MLLDFPVFISPVFFPGPLSALICLLDVNLFSKGLKIVLFKCIPISSLLRPQRTVTAKWSYTVLILTANFYLVLVIVSGLNLNCSSLSIVLVD